ncbi:MAG: hypothetical protein EXR79_05275 [Myxococcales bacterium]|nr:hypothetical protein [Myxococcales bacterium]
MAATVLPLAAAGLALLAGCVGDLVGLTGAAVPVATLQVVLQPEAANLPGNARPRPDAKLRVAIVWAAKVNPDLFCTKHALLPPLDPSAAAVVGAGCRDVLGFAPQLVGPSAPFGPERTATLPLLDLPSATVLIGTPAGRVGYATLVVFDDRDGDGTLKLQGSDPILFLKKDGSSGPDDGMMGPPGPEGGGGGGGGGGEQSGANPAVRSVEQAKGGKEKESDIIHGASFVTMRRPYVKVSYREGTFDLASFYYPTLGCAAPPAGYAVVDVAGPITQAQCKSAAMEGAAVDLAIEPSAAVASVVCRAQNPRYREPKNQPAPQSIQACLSSQELVVAHPSRSCKMVTHFVLKGCNSGVTCTTPQWDVTTKPPDWWPCHGAPPPATSAPKYP